VWHNIPDERITKSFVKKQAKGIGLSEYVRCSGNKTKYFTRLLLELYKWGGSMVLFVIYYLTLQFSKGNMVIVFRYLVSKSLLRGK
jgi:hypothetical protein